MVWRALTTFSPVKDALLGQPPNRGNGRFSEKLPTVGGKKALNRAKSTTAFLGVSRVSDLAKGKAPLPKVAEGLVLSDPLLIVAWCACRGSGHG